MMEPDLMLFALQQLSIDVSLINRNHYLARTNRRENDVEHSYTVALLCWYIHDKYQIPLDIGKILKYALSHDVVERYAGDTNTFASPADRQKKVEREKQALERLASEFSGFPDLVTTMTEYERRGDAESLFVWTVDKMQALVLGDMDNWRPYQEINVTYEVFEAKHKEQLAECSPYCKEIFAELAEYSKSTYYDRPK